MHSNSRYSTLGQTLSFSDFAKHSTIAKCARLLDRRIAVVSRAGADANRGADANASAGAGAGAGAGAAKTAGSPALVAVGGSSAIGNSVSQLRRNNTTTLCSPTQSFMLYFQSPQDDAWVNEAMFDIKGVMDVEVLRASVELTVKRHGSLRTVFSVSEEERISRDDARGGDGGAIGIGEIGGGADATDAGDSAGGVIGAGDGIRNNGRSGEIESRPGGAEGATYKPSACGEDEQLPSPGSAVRCYQHELNVTDVPWFELSHISEDGTFLTPSELSQAERSSEANADPIADSNIVVSNVVGDDPALDSFRRGAMRNLDVQKGPCFRYAVVCVCVCVYVWWGGDLMFQLRCACATRSSNFAQTTRS
jgi:hypothetical protein